MRKSTLPTQQKIKLSQARAKRKGETIREYALSIVQDACNEIDRQLSDPTPLEAFTHVMEACKDAFDGELHPLLFADAYESITPEHVTDDAFKAFQ